MMSISRPLASRAQIKALRKFGYTGFLTAELS
jgi:hypothetical protein